MNIGTPGSAYGPGFSMSRPVLGKGNLGMRVANDATPMRPVQLMPQRRLYDPTVNSKEFLNRIVALRMAPPRAGSAMSPLMRAHQQIAGRPAAAVPPPLTERPEVNAAWGEPGTGPRPLPAPTGLWGGGAGSITLANVGDLLARSRIVHNARKTRT